MDMEAFITIFHGGMDGISFLLLCFASSTFLKSGMEWNGSIFHYFIVVCFPGSTSGEWKRQWGERW